MRGYGRALWHAVVVPNLWNKNKSVGKVYGRAKQHGYVFYDGFFVKDFCGVLGMCLG